MSYIRTISVRLLAASLFLCSAFVAGSLAQQALEKAPPLPPGMTGSNANDPRSKLTPGLWDAGEASMGIKHISLLRKPDAFQLGIDPNSPKVDKALTALGVPREHRYRRR
jgi:hypothetical protein